MGSYKQGVSPDHSELLNDETNRTRFTTVTAAHWGEDSRKSRIIENMAEVKFRGTLSKSKLEKTLQFNISSPLKNQNFES
jgi:hypothetical protein